MSDVYAPGHDATPSLGGGAAYTPAQGAGGVFASFLSGFTAKYAQNAGARETQERNSMARMFINVPRSEFDLFKSSVGDPHARTQLVDRIAGDPANPRRAGNTVVDTGYMDFLLQNIQMGLQEKFQVSETLADNYVAFAFGQSAPMWSVSGVLLNTVQDDQHTNFLRLYLHLARMTQLARRQKVLSLKFDSFILAGAMTSFTGTLNAETQRFIPFSFQFLVKRILIVNYTQGWVPTRPGGLFSADPLAVPSDGRPEIEAPSRADRIRIPFDAEETPTGVATADERVNQQPAAPIESSAGEEMFIRDPQGRIVGLRNNTSTPALVSPGAPAPVTGAQQAAASVTDPTSSLADAADLAARSSTGGGRTFYP